MTLCESLGISDFPVADLGLFILSASRVIESGVNTVKKTCGKFTGEGVNHGSCNHEKFA